MPGGRTINEYEAPSRLVPYLAHLPVRFLSKTLSKTSSAANLLPIYLRVVTTIRVRVDLALLQIVDNPDQMYFCRVVATKFFWRRDFIAELKRSRNNPDEKLSPCP